MERRATNSGMEKLSPSIRRGGAHLRKAPDGLEFKKLNTDTEKDS
jgi:hypothetical protein